MSSTKKTMYLVSAMSLVFMFTFFGIFVRNHEDACFTLGIIFMMIAYHMIIRLVIGVIVDAVCDNNIDSSKGWFEDSDAERAFYRLIRVHKWKKKLPTFDEGLFSLKKHSLEDIIGASCQAEIVHELNIAASLLAMLFAIPFGALWAFVITSIAGALFDLVFVIIQRYNRPRLMRTAEKKRMIFFEKLEYEEAFAEFNGDEQDPDEESEPKPQEIHDDPADPEEAENTENTKEEDP